MTDTAWTHEHTFTILDIVPNERVVTLIHGGFGRTVDQGDYPFGWRWFLEQLKKEAEGER